MRTTHPITTKRCCCIPLVMLYTWLNVGEIMLETLLVFCFKLRMCFARSDTLLVISQEWLVRLTWNEKEVHRLDTGWITWPWLLTSPIIVTLDGQSQIPKELCLRNCWSDWSETERKQINGLTIWPFPLTTPMTLTLTLTLTFKFLQLSFNHEDNVGHRTT